MAAAGALKGPMLRADHIENILLPTGPRVDMFQIILKNSPLIALQWCGRSVLPPGIFRAGENCGYQFFSFFLPVFASLKITKNVEIQKSPFHLIDLNFLAGNICKEKTETVHVPNGKKQSDTSKKNEQKAFEFVFIFKLYYIAHHHVSSNLWRMVVQ